MIQYQKLLRQVLEEGKFKSGQAPGPKCQILDLILAVSCEIA